jgi:hypothetical protein
MLHNLLAAAWQVSGFFSGKKTPQQRIINIKPVINMPVRGIRAITQAQVRLN